MSRKLNDIQRSILFWKEQAPELDALDVLAIEEKDTLHPNSTSKVSEWRLWVWVQAVAIWMLEKLFDIFRKEVEERIAATRVHTRRWYREKALAFQFGDTLNDSDVYDVIDESKQIVKFASVRKVVVSGHGVLRIKVAKDNNGELTKLDTAELDAFKDYMNDITDAGTYIFATSGDPDNLKLELDIYYNPQLIDASGDYLDGSRNAVLPAIKQYLKGIDFDGRLTLTHLIDAMQEVKGIELPVLKYAAARQNVGAYTDLYNMNTGTRVEFYNPDAGWIVLDEANTVINYISYND